MDFISDGIESLQAVEGFLTDVTTRNESQDEAAFLAAIVKSSCDAILGTDLDGKVISANPAVERLTGYSINEIIGSRVSDAQVPQGWEEAHAMIERARAEDGTLENCEVTILTKSGQLRELSISLTPVYGADSKSIGSAITMRDQTELNATRQKLLQSERLAATGQMISAIAHESRNALQRIQVGIDMLGFELPEGADSRKDLNRISRAKEDLQRLFEELRNYAAPLQLECSVCSVADVWRQAWGNLESVRANRRATLIDKCAGSDMDCNVDPFRLEQVFRNLFENALTACDDPVEVSIECREGELEGNPALLIRVCDNGPGMNADQSVRIR